MANKNRNNRNRQDNLNSPRPNPSKNQNNPQKGNVRQNIGQNIRQNVSNVNKQFVSPNKDVNNALQHEQVKKQILEQPINKNSNVSNMYAFGNTARCKAEVNEDAFFIDKIGPFVVLITADGNGTHDGMVNSGNMAIQLMADYLKRIIKPVTRIEDMQNIIDTGFYIVSRCFISVNALGKGYEGIYAGMSVCVIDDISSCMVFGNVGNGEIHLLRGGQFALLNNPHSEAYVAYQHNSNGGIWNDEDWRSHMKRGIVTSALGAMDNYQCEIKLLQLKTDDIVFMSTDGLMYMTGPTGIGEILGEYSENMAEGVNKVLQKADSMGCQDNCTLICAYIITDHGMNLTRTKEKEFQNNALKDTFNTMVTSPAEAEAQKIRSINKVKNQQSSTSFNPYLNMNAGNNTSNDFNPYDDSDVYDPYR